MVGVMSLCNGVCLQSNDWRGAGVQMSWCGVICNLVWLGDLLWCRYVFVSLRALCWLLVDGEYTHESWNTEFLFSVNIINVISNETQRP